MASASGKKDRKGCVAKTPRVLRVRAVGDTFGVAFGTHVYSAVGGAVPLARYRCTKSEAVPFYRKQGGKAEDQHEVTDEDGCALPGDILVADLEKGGWVRLIGGMSERWLPLDGGALQRIDRATETEEPTSPDEVCKAVVPPGFEILTWQACQGAVLKTVVAGFEWGAGAVVVQDTVQARYLRIGTKRSDRPGAVIGDASVSFQPDGTVSSAGGDAILIARPMIGVSWGEDMFDIAGLLNDAGYTAAASAGFAVRPAQRELEAEAVEAGQQALAAEVRGWFAPSPPSNAELVRVAMREAAALRRLWAHELTERRLLRIHEGLVQITAPSADTDGSDAMEDSMDAALISAAAAAEEEIDPMQIWVQVALGSILELASCISPEAGQFECLAFERLIARGTMTFASVAPLSLFSAGSVSKMCVTETVAALDSLVAQMPSLKPPALEMLLALATVTGSSRLVAQALQWLLSGAEEACATRCVKSLRALWQLGSVMHFETQRVLSNSEKRADRKKEHPSWRFVNLASFSRPATSTQRLRSHRTISFEEPCPGGIYWEVKVHASDLRSIILGAWLESKKKFIGCCLHSGAAVGPSTEATLAEPMPEFRSGDVFGVLATTEDLTITCNGAFYSRVQYKKFSAPGERIAVFVEQGPCTQVEVNIGQDPVLHLPTAQPAVSTDAASRATDEAAADVEGATTPAAAPPVLWGRACDPCSECPYEPFVSPPSTAQEVADILFRITERNLGRLGSSVDSGAPVQHAFAKSDSMTITEDGMVVSNVRENSWARVDCEIVAGVSVEFSFEVLDDRENDEGTCYGLSTGECSKYDSRGCFVIRGYSGHLYVDGSDKGEKFPKVHPRSKVNFRFDYSEGRLEAWLDDQEPRVLINDSSVFAGRTLYPSVFNYHGVRTKVKLLRCCSGLRSRASLQDSFALEVTPSATALWLGILEELLAPVHGSPPRSPEALAATGPATTVLKVLLATANASPSIWVEFGAVRGRVMRMIELIVIERRNDPALQQPRDIAILLISVLGVGALFGGPEQVLKVFLSIRDSGASRLGQTLVAYLLGTRRSAPVSADLVLDLSRLAVSDELGCQILLRLALSAFTDGVEKLGSIASGVLHLVGELGQQLALDEGAPPFVSELLPVLAQLLAALPRREPTRLNSMLDLLQPATKALTCLRRRIAQTDQRPPRFVTDAVYGLDAFICGVAGLLMSHGDLRPFPLDIGDADLRDEAAALPPPKALAHAERVIADVAGADDTHSPAEGPPMPDIVAEILAVTGRGEAVVCALHQKSPFSASPVNAVQRAAFAAAVLCEGPDVWELIADDASGAAARPAWQAAALYTNNRVRPMKHSIAANEGDAKTFEAALAEQVAWIARHIVWAEDYMAPLPQQISRSATAPESRRPRLPVVERMRHLERMNAFGCAAGREDAPAAPTSAERRHDLSKAKAQLVTGAVGDGVDPLIAAASSQRDVALGRRLGARLLRFLVRSAAEAGSLEPLLPPLHAALEETLAQPLGGMAHAGFSQKRATLAELAALLREIQAQLAAPAPAASPAVAVSPLSSALALAMLCVPLPREELEPLLGSLLSSLPSMAFDAGPEVAGSGAGGYCRMHTAMLILRVYISARGGGGPALAALLGQLAASLDGLLAPAPAEALEPPLPPDTCMDPFEVDWDFGSLGRLCPRRLDAKRLCEEVAAQDSQGAARADAEAGLARCMTLRELRRQRACGLLPRAVAASLLLRLPQGEKDEAAVDVVEALQVLRASRGEPLPWAHDRRHGACAAALTLLRPIAELLPLEVPGIAERLLRAVVGTASTGDAGASRRPLPSALAVSLYFRLQVPDEQLAADAPRLLALLTAAGRAADDALPPARRGSLALAALVSRQLVSRARAVTPAVLGALNPEAIAQVPLSNSARSALELVGGPSRCAACHMQVLGTLSGRSLVVGADRQHIAVLSLDGALDAKAVQWVKCSDLQVPPHEASVVPGVGRAHLWGEQVVNCLLSAVQWLLRSRDHTRIPPELLRALALVLPSSPRWDVGIATEVVRELDELAAAGVNDLSGSPIELLEHRCALLKLALWQERARSSTAHGGEAGASEKASAEATTRQPQPQHPPRTAAPPAALVLPLQAAAASACPGPGAADASPSSACAGAPPLLSVLNQGAEWRGRYKLKRQTNTWYKLKWHMELRLSFRAGGELDAIARWPKFAHPSNARSGKWRLEGGGGLFVEFGIELPGGRREGGRTRDCEVFAWKGRLVQTRGCPHLEGTASGRTSELKYEWYAVPPDPLELLRATELDLFGRADESLPRPFSLLGFNTGFIEQNAEHFRSTLGLNFTKADGTARDLAAAAVKQLPRYQYINGPREVAKVAKQSPEESWGMKDSLEDDDALGGQIALEERWCSVGEVLGEEDGGARPVAEVTAVLEREERQLRLSLLMRMLQVMLANRPADAGIADCFREPAAREAFFRRALRLPDAGVVLQRCADDFVASAEVAQSALTVAVEGLLTPFMAGGVSTLTVESDHDYHPNEDWAFRLSIPGAQRMRLKFDSRCKTENGRDFLQFFGERDLQGNFARRLHSEEKLSGHYPAGFPDLIVPGDRVWFRFQSDASEQFWGFKFTLSGEGGGSGAAAVPFPAALKLLVAASAAVPESERSSVRLMGASVLLSVSAAQPLSDEATRAAEALCELLPEPCQWSDSSWSAALSLMSVAERNGRRQLLASLVTLLSTQMGPSTPLLAGVGQAPALLLDRMRPSSGGVLLNGRTTLVAGGSGRTCAVGLPLPVLARAGHALFCVKVEPAPTTSAGAGRGPAPAGVPEGGAVAAVAEAGGGVGIGVGLAPLQDRASCDATFDAALFCDATSISQAGEELSVEVQRHGPGGSLLRLLVAGSLGTVQRELPASWRTSANLLPALWVEGFGAAVTLRPPPSASHDSEAAAGRLEQLQRTSQLVEACRGGRRTPLPAALVAGAWARREGGDEADVAAVQERLRGRCAAVAESEHPHAWGVAAQKLQVPGASALELSFPRLELAEGYRLRITHDPAGELSVTKPCASRCDGGVQHTVEFGKYLFATLDDADPKSREKGLQEGWRKVPAGWELVPGQPDVVREVIAKHRWATDVMVVGSGEAYYTLGFDHGSKAGQSCGKDRLASRGGADRSVEYQPSRVAGRVLIRRLRPDGAGPAVVGASAPLAPEELAPGERVVVPGSVVYIHGPLPQLPRWDAPAAAAALGGLALPPALAAAPGGEGRGSKALRPPAAAPPEPPAEAAGPPAPKPSLCCGTWVWHLSPGCHVTLVLMPDGRIMMSGTSLDVMLNSELEDARDSAEAAGEAAAQQDAGRAGWVEPSRFRLARVRGTWDVESRIGLQVELEGADHLGVATMRFSSTSAPEIRSEAVVVRGEVSHMRWGTCEVVVNGQSSMAARITSSWTQLEPSRDGAVEVQIMGYAHPPSVESVHVLISSEACPEQAVAPQSRSGSAALAAAVTADEAIMVDDEEDEDAAEEELDGGAANLFFAGSRLYPNLDLLASRPRLLRHVGPTVQRSLVLREGEYLEGVLAEGGEGRLPLRVRARTNLGRSIAWPPAEPVAPEPLGERSWYMATDYQAPEGNEIVSFRPPGDAALDRFMACRLLPRRPPPAPAPQSVPEGLWEGTLQMGLQPPEPVRACITASATLGSFTAQVEAGGGATAGCLLGGEALAPGAAAATLTLSEIAGCGRLEWTGQPSRRLSGRCTIDASHRVCLLLVAGRFSSEGDGAASLGEDEEDPTASLPLLADGFATPSCEFRNGVRLALRSRGRLASVDAALPAPLSPALAPAEPPAAAVVAGAGAGLPTVDGPSLVYHGLGSSTSYLLHAAQAPWTQQIASEHLVAEVVVQQLSASGGLGGGLILGLSDDRPKSGAEVRAWPGPACGQWLWRSDGAIARGRSAEQRSALWRFGPGDSVGFAVARGHVSFLRNGERVHTAPRRLQGEKEHGRASAPVLFVGLSSSVVLRLAEGTQHLGLCEDALAVGDGERESAAGFAPPRRAATAAATPAAAFRRCGRAVLWLTRLLRARFGCSVAWAEPAAPRRAAAVAAADAAAGAGASEGEADVWIECTFSGTAPCITKGRSLVEEFGGEARLRELFAQHIAEQGQPEDPLAAAAEVREVYINDLGLPKSGLIETARVSALIRLDGVERLQQARLERRGPKGGWRVAELLSEVSGSRCLCWALRPLPPGTEVVPAVVDGGWLQVDAAWGEETGALWYPIEKAGAGPRFARKRDLDVRDSPVYSCAAARHFAGAEGSQATAELVGVSSPGLPAVGEPYTAEAFIRVSSEDCGRDMCVVAWGDADCGLAIQDDVASAGGLRGSIRICDGAWHHVAVTFDGRERRLWVDYELAAFDSPHHRRGGGAAVGAGTVRQDGLAIGAYPRSAVESGSPLGRFRGDIKRLRIWRAALTPAAMKVYATRAESQVRDEITAEAVRAVFRGVDSFGAGELAHTDLGVVFSGAAERFFLRLDAGRKGFVTCSDWVGFCSELKDRRGEPHLMRFLQACARNLGQKRRPLQVLADCEHPCELMSELSLSSSSFGWRVEAKPVSLSDTMLERIEDEGLERFWRQVKIAHALLGSSADEAIVELADRLALQHGNHDDCWTKMLGVAEWSRAQPRLMEQAVAHAKPKGLSVAAKMREVLAWAIASSRSLEEVLPLAPFAAPLAAAAAATSAASSSTASPRGSERSRLQKAREAAEHAGGSPEACGELAEELLRLAEDAVAAAVAAEDSGQRAGSGEEAGQDQQGQHQPASAPPPPGPGATQQEQPPPSPSQRPQQQPPTGSSQVQAAVDAMFREAVGQMMFVRFLILLELNWSVSRDFLPLIDLAAPADSAYGRLLAQVKPRLLGHLKFSQFQHVLQSTKYEGSTPSIILNRKAAVTLRERGRVDWEFRRSLIGQFLSEIRKQPGGPKLFRRLWQSRCVKVQFKGEGGEDAGGLYREALDAIAQELHSKTVPLFVPCPNAVAEVGDNRDAWVFNPRATAPECIRALEFVGQLLGLALRTGDLLPLTLAPFVWKGIVGDERKREDVRSIDVFADKHLSIFSSEERRPDEESLEAMGGLQFAYPDVTGEEIELIEGGREESVTPENSSEFARLLLQNRLTFDQAQLQALRRGLSTVVPIQLIRLWSWRDLQERVCGVPEVDLDNLRRHTTYKNCTSSSLHVQHMWEALEAFTQKQRRSFLRFVWGRSSLPTVEKWERNFTVQLLSGTGDSRLPCSHTCFFTLDLPSYSSSEICQSKLLYCITHCLAIDADGAAARSLNWDEDDD